MTATFTTSSPGDVQSNRYSYGFGNPDRDRHQVAYDLAVGDTPSAANWVANLDA